MLTSILDAELFSSLSTGISPLSLLTSLLISLTKIKKYAKLYNWIKKYWGLLFNICNGIQISVVFNQYDWAY